MYHLNCAKGITCAQIDQMAGEASTSARPGCHPYITRRVLPHPQDISFTNRKTVFPSVRNARRVNFIVHGASRDGDGDDIYNVRKWFRLVSPQSTGRTDSQGMSRKSGNSLIGTEGYVASGQSGDQQQGHGPSSNSKMPTSQSNDGPTFNDWYGALDDDWEDWAGTPAVADLDDEGEVAELREQIIERRRARRGRRTRVRDEYLRPIVDVTGIYNRLAFDEKEAEERVFVEAITNQYESREALKYAGTLLAVPLTVGFVISHLVAQPLWEYAESLNPDAFALSDEQKVEGAHAMHREEVRLRLEASIGQAPPLTDQAMLEHLHIEAVKFAEDMRADNRQSLLNVISDSSSGVALFVILLQKNSQRAILFRTIGRVFTGLSDTAKAFLIILVTDTLLGYHSEEGWTAGLTLLGRHYGLSAAKDGLQLFVATVPVVLDSLFKYWIFVGLNKIDPAAAVTLRQMDRH